MPSTPRGTKKYHITRVAHVVQSAVVSGASPSEAIESSKKLEWKNWHSVDRKRRRNYAANEVKYE